MNNALSDLAVLVVRLDAQGGLEWARSWPCIGACNPDSLVLDGAGQSVVSVLLDPSSAVVIEDRASWADWDSESGVVAKLDRDGALVWPARGVRADVKLALGSTGAIYMTGSHGRQIAFGEGEALNLDAGEDGEDLYVARARP